LEFTKFAKKANEQKSMTGTDDIRISQVHSARDINRFIKIPWSIYRKDPFWIPPLVPEQKRFLDPAKNPFFKHADVGLFLAYDIRSKVVGRIAAIVNHRHNALYQDNVGFFGLFECIDNDHVASALFNAASDFLRSKGLGKIRGPISLSINDEIGLLVDGFDIAPSVMMTHNPRYYARLFEHGEFLKAIDIWSYAIDHASTPLPERFARQRRFLAGRIGIRVRKADPKQFDREIAVIHNIHSEAWSQNWGAVPLTEAEFQTTARSLRQIIDPDFCLIAEINNSPIGFCVAVPDINQALNALNGHITPWGLARFWLRKRSIKTLCVIIMGVLPAFRRKGVEACMIHDAWVNAVKKGITSTVTTWILENNTPMNLVMRKLGGRVYKTFRIYERPL
jgi:GNAT superfamily N-acetyltransferase